MNVMFRNAPNLAIVHAYLLKTDSIQTFSDKVKRLFVHPNISGQPQYKRILQKLVAHFSDFGADTTNLTFEDVGRGHFEALLGQSKFKFDP